ncbi:hypothetical protein Pcinc_008392 [Petrolisthes cinctipes]|uniref:Uncharacterized protein n=1 Tax=Petrolisthes cinctipes TaxID=88211 RepID=A0AAE1KXB5_PETCI|nr:hypothetical protein Pcinc_008392 [Petrolisthes cinctipes]
MRSLIVLSVVLGMAYGQGFPQETPEVAAARAAFIAEYNRLAELAALAPDINIIYRDPNDPIMPRPDHPPHFNTFSFRANLGDNTQFQPGPNTFPYHSPGHLAGHLAGHSVASRPAIRSRPQPAPQLAAEPKPVASFPVHRFSPAPIQRWTGPLADDIPAGVGGSVMETPSVVAAKAAHFQAHADHYNTLARLNPQ